MGEASPNGDGNGGRCAVLCLSMGRSEDQTRCANTPREDQVLAALALLCPYGILGPWSSCRPLGTDRRTMALSVCQQQDIRR
jgi:hypothetical protein